MKKILVIEDDPQILEALRDILTLENFHVITANNGKSGLENALRHLPDLVVSDIMMPEMDGFAVLENLRNNPRTFGIPFLFLTAKADKSEQRKGMNIGADDYITKPFDNEEIVKAVKARLSKHSSLVSHYSRRLEDLQAYITSSLPHELRSPLNVILGFSQIIESSSQEELDFNDIKMMNRNILDAGKRLLRIVVNYTYYTKMNEKLQDKFNESSPDTEIPVCENPKLIVNDYALEWARRYGRVSDIELSLVNAPVMLPEEYLGKISEELIDNALKFSMDSTIIDVKSYVAEGYYHISVGNKGRGMTKAQISRISPFLQFDREEYEQQGSGLGLSIVRKIADLYNCKFDIESEPGIFFNIKVSIPLKSGQ